MPDTFITNIPNREVPIFEEAMKEFGDPQIRICSRPCIQGINGASSNQQLYIKENYASLHFLGNMKDWKAGRVKIFYHLVCELRET